MTAYFENEKIKKMGELGTILKVKTNGI